MIVTIFGASGRTGHHLVRIAQQQNHQVKAFVRNRSRLHITDARIEVIEGNVHDPEAVERAIAGSNAVISALGWTRTSRKDVLSEAARNIVNTMKKYGVRRIIALTGYGVRFPKDPPDSLSKKLLHLGIKIILPNLIPDGIRYAKIISESGLDWTIARAVILSNKKGRRQYRTGYFDPGITLTPREDVARFMIEQLTEKKYLGEAPVIA